MANFEALIKQALKTQDSTNPVVREKIYASSRNALRRMLEKSGNQPVESLKAHMSNLENSIAKIERGFSVTHTPAPVAAPRAQLVEPQVPPQQSFNPAPNVQANIPTQNTQPELAPRAVPPSSQVAPEPALQVHEQVQAATLEPSLLESAQQVVPPISAEEPVYESVEIPPPAEDRPQYKRTNPLFRRIWWLLFIIAGLAVALWLLYAASFWYGTSTQNTVSSQSRNNAAPQAEDSHYITLIDANDPSALITSGRGSATLINELNGTLLRIQSVRQNGVNNIADPILLELQQGVLNQIAGKDVTFEIKVKSGEQKNATFSVSCNFAGVNACGRKRFQAGLQPVDVIFAVKAPANIIDGNAFLAINTDVTSQADTTGTGDKIDIVYARVRIAK